MSTKILIVGSAIDHNLIRFITSVKASDKRDTIILDVLHTNPHIYSNSESELSEIKSSIRNLYIMERFFWRYLYKINQLPRFFDLLICLLKIKRNEYDVINIHYMSPYFFPLWSVLKGKAKKMVISPWGSDVYRIGRLKTCMIRQCYQGTDYVTSGSSKFKKDIIEKFDVEDSKFVDIGFGSIMIDEICNNTRISKEEAKKKMGIDGRYVVVCGYNASSGQQHLAVISALEKVKMQLPENYILLFPMTYVKQDSYMSEVKKRLDESLIPYIIYDDYLTEEEQVYLRKCTDIFIHVQTTDAFSASVQEYLLCDTIVINGNWVRYPDLEKWGLPYLLIDSIDDISKVICRIVEGNEEIHISENLKKSIISRGYSKQANKWVQFYNYISES
jgi:hypothetical protein